MTDATIFATRRTLTMNPTRPTATHIAVRDGRILAVGDLDEVKQWGDFPVDRTFADKFVMPGLIEGHSHVMEGTFWQHTYVGYHDRMDPNGKIWPGLVNLDAVIQRLQEAEAAMPDPNAPLIAWGFDPIFFGRQRCTRADLDRVSDSRIVAVIHASVHIINTNSAGLKALDWLRTGLRHPGLPLADDGMPSGELKGPEAMIPLVEKTPLGEAYLGLDTASLQRFARLCVRQGVTTATDLACPLDDAMVQLLIESTSKNDYPARIVPLMRMIAEPVDETVEKALRFKALSTDKALMGRIKLVADGSIQGFSARLRWPGYFNGAQNGLWYMAPEQIREALSKSLAAGIDVHVHTNGDEASALVLEVISELARSQPLGDHRTTLQHCQLADEAQFRKMASLGMAVNLFANHTFYWGDEHYAQTVGPERAERMNDCAGAMAAGVPFAIHSDAPITPLGPLFTAWCAVNRQTSSGRILGKSRRIEVDQALRAITVGAAYTLRLDDDIGSIAVGKRADFAVLEQDPTEVDAAALKDIPIWGTVLGGKKFAAKDA